MLSFVEKKFIAVILCELEYLDRFPLVIYDDAELYLFELNTLILNPSSSFLFDVKGKPSCNLKIFIILKKNKKQFSQTTKVTHHYKY